MAPRKRKQTRSASKVVIVPVLIPVIVFVERKSEESEKKAGWRGWLETTDHGATVLLAAITLAGLLLSNMSCGKKPDPPKPNISLVVVDDRDFVINMVAPQAPACAPPKKPK